MKPMRPHQQKAFDDLRESIRIGKNRPLLQAPVSWGKTVVASHIIASARNRGRRVLFTVPAISLVEQSVRAFYDEGIRDIGVMQGYHEMTDHSKPVQVASVQTLAQREIERPDLVIVDEAHRGAEILKTLMEQWPETPFVGLSATPWSRGMGRYYNNLIVSARIGDLIKLGYSSPFRVFAPSHPDLSGVKTVTTANGRDYAEGELSEAMQSGTLTADVVSTWMQRGRGRPTLCFAVDRAHAMALHKQFEAAGVRSAYQDGDHNRDQRDVIRRQFESGQIEVICQIGTLVMGVDWDVRCIIWARPTKSEIFFVQGIGRGMRTAPGKDYLLILDHSDTTLNLGFITDIHHERLNDGAPASQSEAVPKDKLPRECPKCTTLFPKFARACPECGWEPKLQPRDVETVDGELVELDGKKGAKSASMEEKIRWFRQLKAYQIEARKSDGFIAHKFKAKFGTWPNHPSIRHAAPAAGVDADVRAWLKAQAIRYAKGKAAEQEAASLA